MLQPGVDTDAELIAVDLVPPVPGYVQHISWLDCHNVGSSHGQIGKDPEGVMGQVDEVDRAVSTELLIRYSGWREIALKNISLKTMGMNLILRKFHILSTL